MLHLSSVRGSDPEPLLNDASCPQDTTSDSPDLDSLSTSPEALPRRPSGIRLPSSRRIPSQAQAKRFYKWLIPVSFFFVIMGAVPIVISYLIIVHVDAGSLRALIDAIPLYLIWTIWVLAVIFHPILYIYHYYRLRGSQDPPALLDDFDIQHVVVVCAYKEPLEVLLRTFESIAGQKGLKSKPFVVFAAESRDDSRQASFARLQHDFGGRLGRLQMTEHELVEGEAAGKAANENFAVRALCRELITEESRDPFSVMVTIVDADSILASAYLAHVEAGFLEQPDGRRSVYVGPLNVFRNFSEANPLVQLLELNRCHTHTFHNIFSPPYPYSNYSLTLGFAAEIGFWTPDVMPEDIHTANKAMVNNYGSRTTVAIPSIICNDLVSRMCDRYAQAKRHQYGSVTEFAWLAALFTDMRLRFPAWWAVFVSETTRAGSFLSTLALLLLWGTQTAIGMLVAAKWELLNWKLILILRLIGSYLLWETAWFWLAQIILWSTVLKQFPIERPSFFRWLVILLLSPVANTLNLILFLFVPTLHGLIHATCVGELAYVCAPKGSAAAAAASGRTRPAADEAS